ncbi:N-terminal C2 in EEIG1 and EHBP1 proteins domain containing protein [Hyaloscypha variabilis]
MNPLISKARRPKFELVLRIIDLNNVPLVTGTSYIKWHLPSSTSAEHRGRTDRSPIKEHKVSWDYSRTIPVRLTIDKSNNLQETLINFEVVQDYGSTVRGEKITLGHVTLNLAEYVEESEMGPDGEEGVTRRYLMQESKINSTLKIGIMMKQIDGERNFTAPPLKTAPVFGGIAGIMAGDQAEQDDVGHMPSISKNRDHGELQDMYRRALAASWAADSTELPADKCIEDIFNGGDGWKHEKNEKPATPRIIDENSASDEHLYRHHRNYSGGSSHSQSTITVTRNKNRIGHKHTASQESLGPDSATGHDTSSESSERGRTGFRKVKEIDEFDVRDDLVAWQLPSRNPGTVS